MGAFQSLINRLLILLFLFIIACAKPEVVDISNPKDDKMDCNELENSIAEAQKFKRDAIFEKANTGGNMARFLLFWPAAATTFHNSDKAIRAANDRTYHLIKIMKKKNCENIDLINAEILKNLPQQFLVSYKYLKSCMTLVI